MPRSTRREQRNSFESDATDISHGSSDDEGAQKQHVQQTKTKPSASPKTKATKNKTDKKLEPQDKGSSSSSSEEESEVKALRYPGLGCSTSYRQLNTIAGCHQYCVSGFSLARGLGNGIRLCSDFFPISGQPFRIEVYPAGADLDSRKHISVFLTTPGAATPNQLVYEVAVLDQSGSGKHLVQTQRAGQRVVPFRGVLAAFPRFVKAKELQKNAKRFLVNDTLVIRATVEVLRSWKSQPCYAQPGQAQYLSGMERQCHPAFYTAQQQHYPTATPAPPCAALPLGCHCCPMPSMPPQWPDRGPTAQMPQLANLCYQESLMQHEPWSQQQCCCCVAAPGPMHGASMPVNVAAHEGSMRSICVQQPSLVWQYPAAPAHSGGPSYEAQQPLTFPPSSSSRSDSMLRMHY